MHSNDRHKYDMLNDLNNSNPLYHLSENANGNNTGHNRTNLS